jgi:O-acetyl-ADP-ribose deacetylase (regulator of RNase III)
MLILFTLLLSVAVIAGKDLSDDLSDLADSFMRLTRVLPPAASDAEYALTLKNGKKIVVVLGDITKQNVDAIVNAANEGLTYGLGVAGAIYNAAAPQSALQQKTVKELYPAGCTVGSACLTLAFGSLRTRGIRFVVEAVGPMCKTKNKPTEAEEDLIDGAYKAVFRQIHNFNGGLLPAVTQKITELTQQKTIEDSGVPIRSVAFPLISAAIFGCGEENVIRRALKVLYDLMSGLQAEDSLTEARLVIYPLNPAHAKNYLQQARDRLDNLMLADS